MKKILILAFIFILANASAQHDEPKFGKIDLSDMTLQKYDKDSSAEALMLFDYGETGFYLNRDRKFQFIFTRHYRLKIFKKEAFNLGDISIRLHKTPGTSKKEILGEFKAATFNLVDGKIVKTKVEYNKVFTTETKRYDEKKFAFPEVKEGSILEFSYSITSDFLYNLRGWYFQHSYPVVWSQYSMGIPEYFDYRQTSRGYLTFDVNKKETKVGNFNLHFDSQSDAFTAGGGRTAKEDYTLSPTIYITTLGVSNVPAFHLEPNIDCEDNYLQSIEYELCSIQYPNDMRHDYTTSWEQINKTMREDEDFGALLSSNKFIQDTVKQITAGTSTETDKARNIYNYIQRRMTWNERYNLYCYDGLKKPFLAKSGYSAEINLLLTLMLRAAGIKADPVLFSTRENGMAATLYPTVSKFNSVLCEAQLDGKKFQMDATNKYCPFGTLPAEDINGSGRLINELNGAETEIQASEKYTIFKMNTLEISADGKLKGILAHTYLGYAAVRTRTDIDEEKSLEKYFRKMEEDSRGFVINKYSVKNLNDINQPVFDSLQVELSEYAEIIGDKILIYPLLFDRISKNPYTLEDRKYPLNYNYPLSRTIVTEFTIPNGYEVESLPKAILIKLPDNSVTINYKINSEGNKIRMMYKFNINKVLFLPDEYQSVKEIYNELVKKGSEQVILKKSA